MIDINDMTVGAVVKHLEGLDSEEQKIVKYIAKLDKAMEIFQPPAMNFADSRTTEETTAYSDAQNRIDECGKRLKEIRLERLQILTELKP